MRKICVKDRNSTYFAAQIRVMTQIYTPKCFYQNRKQSRGVPRRYSSCVSLIMSLSSETILQFPNKYSEILKVVSCSEQAFITSPQSAVSTTTNDPNSYVIFPTLHIFIPHFSQSKPSKRTFS